MTRKHQTPPHDQPTAPDDDYDVQASSSLAELEKIAVKHGAPSRLGAELDALPPVAALDAIKANAAVGYYDAAPAGHLAADLAALCYETDEHRALLGALVERAKAGAFSAAKRA